MLNTEIPRLPHKKLGRWFLKLFTNSTSSAPHLQLLQDPKFSSAVWMERLEHEFLYLIISLFQLLLGFPATPTTILMSSTLPIACQETLKEIKLKHSPHGKHRRGKNRRAWMGKRLRRNSWSCSAPKKLQDTGRCHSPGCWELGHCNLSSTRDFGCSNTLH